MWTRGQNRRGRPRSFAHQDVMERSVGLLWSRGANKTTMRVLEEELGLGQSSLYNTYKSKEALIDQAVAHYEIELQTNVLSRLADPSRSAMLDFLDALATWIRDDEHRGCMVLNLALEEPDQAYRMTGYRRMLRDTIRQSLATFIDDEGEVAAKTEMIVAAVFGLILAAKTAASQEEISRTTDALKAQISRW